MKRAFNQVFVGMTGSGKTTAARAAVEHISRWMVWDMKGEYRLPRVETKVELWAAIRSPKFRRIAFTSEDPKDFTFFCDAAFARALDVRPMAVIVEELADVTSPGKAPLAWGKIVRRGRDRDIHVVAVTQRPQESDKTILGNRTRLWCGRLPSPRDASYMADHLRITAADLAALPEYGAYIQDGLEPARLTVKSRIRAK